MNITINYEKEKRKATIGIAASAAVLVLALSISLSALFFYLDAVKETIECQRREEEFNPWQDSSKGQDSYKMWEALGLTEEFAADFKETYHYYFAFDTSWYPFIVKMKGTLGEEYQPLIDYVYEDGAKEPEPVRIRGIAIPIEDDIREYAIESINILYGEELLTDDNFENYLGVSILDTTQKPMGRADFSAAKYAGIFGAVMILAGTFLLAKGIRNRKNIGLAQIKEQEAMRQAAMWQNPGDSDRYPEFGAAGYGYQGFENTGEMSGSRGYDNLGVNTEASVYTGVGGFRTETAGGISQSFGGYTNNSGIRLEPVEKSNVLLGIIGALGGSLVGVALWILLSRIGIIAGIAGFVMLKFALKGYEKLSGKLDKKGAVISLLIAVFMIFFANVLDYLILICHAFFEWDASFDTVRYVVMNFANLMTNAGSWGGFCLNLVLGYGLSIWASYRLIGQILSYKETN